MPITQSTDLATGPGDPTYVPPPAPLSSVNAGLGLTPAPIGPQTGRQAPAQGTGAPLGDADLWEKLAAYVPPDSATKIVENRRNGVAPQDSWEELHKMTMTNGKPVPVSVATKLTAFAHGTPGAQPSGPTVAPFAADDAAVRPIDPNASTFGGNIARSLGQGATFGFSDELAGKLPASIGGGAATEADMRTRQNAFHAAHPWLDLGAKAVGGMAAPLALAAGAALLPEEGAAAGITSAILGGGGMLGNAARTATLAGAAGAGMSDAPTLGGRLDAAILPAAGGFVLGTALPPIAGAVARNVAPLASRLGAPAALQQILEHFSGPAPVAPANGAPAVTTAAAGVINRALAQQGTSLDQVAADRPDMLAHPLAGLARLAKVKSAQAAATIDQGLAAQPPQLPAIGAALEKGAGVPRGSLSTTQADLIAQQRALAGPMYAKAYLGPDVTDPQVLEAFQHPLFQKAYQRGQTIAALEPNSEPIPDLPSAAPGASGALPPSVQQMLADMPPAQRPAFLAKYYANNGGAPAAGDAAGTGISVRGIDYAKMGLNDMIDEAQRSGNNKLAGALTTRLQDVLSRVDATNPDYAAARSTFAGYHSLIKAGTAGTDDFASPTAATAATVTQKLAAMSPGEQALYRQGAIEATMSKAEAAAGSTTGKANVLNNLYSSVGGRDKINALMQSPADQASFEDAMGRFADQTQARNYIQGNSQTANYLGNAQDVFGGSSSPMSAADVGAFFYNPKAALVRAALGKLTGAAAKAETQRAIQTATDVSGPLVARGAAMDNVIAQIRQQAAARAQQAAAQRAVINPLTAGAVGSGTAGAFNWQER